MLLWHARDVVRRLSSEYALSERCARSWVKLAVVTASGDDVSGFSSEMRSEFFCSVEPLWRQRRTFLSSCHTQDCNSTGNLPITECDLILTDGADELRCAAAFFYSSSAEILKNILLGFLSNHDLSFFLVRQLMPPRAPDLSDCPGLSLPRLKLWRWLISPFERPVHCVNIVFFGLILVLFVFFPLLASRHRRAHALLRRFSCWFQTWSSPRVCSTEPGGSNSGWEQQTFVFSVQTHNETEQSKHLFLKKSMLSPHHWWSLKRPSRKLEPKVCSWLTGSTGTVQGSLPAWCQLNTCAF